MIRVWRMLCLGLILAGGLPAAELKDFQDYLTAQRALIDSRHRERMEALVSKYRASLRGLMERSREEGDLDRTLLLKKTIERFEREGPSELGPPLSDMEAFRTLQDIWLRVRNEHRAARAGKLLEVFGQMNEALAPLEVRLTREGRLDEALAVRAERDRLREGPEAKELRAVVEAAKREDEAVVRDPGAGGGLLPVMTVFGADLVLYFPFDRDTGKRVVDRSREENHGISRGAEWTPEGRRGGGMRFDGNVSVVVDNHESLQLTGDLSISMWLKPEKLEARRNPLHKSYGAEMSMALWGEDSLRHYGSMNFHHGTAGKDAPPYQFFFSEETLELGRWTHVCVVRDFAAEKLSWYFNGRLVASEKTMFQRAAPSDRPLILGDGHNQPYIGDMDEVMIFPKALSSQEVRRIYRSTGGN